MIMDKEPKKSFLQTNNRVRQIVNNEALLTERLQTIYDFEEIEIPSFDELKIHQQNVFLNEKESYNTMFSSVSDSSIPQPPPSTPIESTVEENWKTTAILRFALNDSLDSPFIEERSPNDEETVSNISDKKTKHNIVKKIQILSQQEINILDERQIKECSLFGRIENFASLFVDDIITTSIDKILQQNKDRSIIVNTKKEIKESNPKINDDVLIKWPRICDFTIIGGESCINDFILTWTFDEAWLYCIDFLLVQSDEYSDYFYYEVKWSIPTNRFPIPRATASVYFTIEASKFKPRYCKVDVTYVFEGTKFVHSPGEIEFHESFLFDIIYAKLNTFQNMLA